MKTNVYKIAEFRSQGDFIYNPFRKIEISI